MIRVVVALECEKCAGQTAQCAAQGKLLIQMDRASRVEIEPNITDQARWGAADDTDVGDFVYQSVACIAHMLGEFLGAVTTRPAKIFAGIFWIMGLVRITKNIGARAQPVFAGLILAEVEAVGRIFLIDASFQIGPYILAPGVFTVGSHAAANHGIHGVDDLLLTDG